MLACVIADAFGSTSRMRCRLKQMQGTVQYWAFNKKQLEEGWGSKEAEMLHIPLLLRKSESTWRGNKEQLIPGRWKQVKYWIFKQKVLIRKAACDKTPSFTRWTTQTCIKSRGVKALLSDERTRAVAQDNKVACCHSVARCEPDNPPKTSSLSSCSLLACAGNTALLYLGVQHRAK